MLLLFCRMLVALFCQYLPARTLIIRPIINLYLCTVSIVVRWNSLPCRLTPSIIPPSFDENLGKTMRFEGGKTGRERKVQGVALGWQQEVRTSRWSGTSVHWKHPRCSFIEQMLRSQEKHIAAASNTRTMTMTTTTAATATLTPLEDSDENIPNNRYNSNNRSTNGNG